MAAQKSMSEKPNLFRMALLRIALSLVRGVRSVATAIGPALAHTAASLGRLLARVFLLPTYRLLTVAQLRTRRFILPARGLVLLLFTNRYLLHVLIAGIAIATVATNLTVRQANAQDVGRQSLLYAMVTGDESRMTEQEVRPDLLVRDSRYTGPESLQALPDIDFDYDEGADVPLTAISVPGTIVATPEPHEANQPGAPTSPRTNTEEYVVQAGDTLSAIAQRFGVNVGTILWANSRTEFQYLRPGDTLKIPPVSGVLVTVKKGDTLLSLANKYGSDIDEITRVNRLSPDQALPVGLELTLPGGQPPAVVSTYVARDPVPIHNTITAPSSVARPADADTSSLPSTKLLWPTSGHVITQYYGWQHTGVDIDGDYTSPIYASHDGVVTTAGWNSGGYGLQIIVSGDGVKTRYAHSSKMFVKVGDVVKKGQVIAMVGTTGRSTGTHLHFEVYINGKRTNPLTYIR